MFQSLLVPIQIVNAAAAASAAGAACTSDSTNRAYAAHIWHSKYHPKMIEVKFKIEFKRDVNTRWNDEQQTATATAHCDCVCTRIEKIVEKGKTRSAHNINANTKEYFLWLRQRKFNQLERRMKFSSIVKNLDCEKRFQVNVYLIIFFSSFLFSLAFFLSLTHTVSVDLPDDCDLLTATVSQPFSSHKILPDDNRESIVWHSFRFHRWDSFGSSNLCMAYCGFNISSFLTPFYELWISPSADGNATAPAIQPANERKKQRQREKEKQVPSETHFKENQNFVK